MKYTHWRAVLPCLALAGLATGCMANRQAAPWPPPRPLGSHYDTMASEIAPVGPRPKPAATLDLDQAISRALLHNPTLSASYSATLAADARATQARALPNPQLEIEVEEYDRDGAGSDSAEIAFVLSQQFELSGARRHRSQTAEARRTLAGWAYESTRLDVITATTRRFVAAIAAERQLELAKSALSLAGEMSEAVSERVRAGKEPPLQAAKAASELELARLALLQAQNTLTVSRQRLASMWGSEKADFETLDGSLETVLQSIPSLESLRSILDMDPDLARWEAEVRIRQGTLKAQQAERVPTLNAFVGHQQYEEDGTDAMAFGIGFPLPLFDRNRANIDAARHDLAAIEAQRKAATTALVSVLAEAHANLVWSQQRVATLRTELVPAMENAFKAAREGYRQGKFSFLDMLDAQGRLVTARRSLVDALLGYHVAIADIERITGTDINERIQGGPDYETD